MLEQLYVKNFAIIENQSVPFAAGFNVLSGETGAGKSILIDALGLQLGDRADSNWIRHGSSRCEIQSEFLLAVDSAAIKWVKSHELDDANNDAASRDATSLQLRRTLSQGGKSRCYINGIPSTLGTTKTLGEMLLAIHGQHAHQSLTSPEQQLTLLDGFAAHDKLLQSVKKAYRDWQKLLQKQQQLADADNSLSDRRDLLTYQLQEILDISVGDGEFEQLEKQQQRLAAAQDILHHVNLLDNALSGDNGLSSGLNRVIQIAAELSGHDSDGKDIGELLEQALIYAEEAQAALNHYAQGVEVDPQALQDTETRMGQLYDLARKHQVTPTALMELQEKLQNQLDTINASLAELQDLDKTIQQAQAHYRQLADELSASRQQAAERLMQAVAQQLQQLNLENADFTIALTAANNAKSHGTDKVVFMFAANPGQGSRPLHKIASGGELSRISLAIQVAAIRHKTEATLIFDEVDSGIGGATAEVVGRLLKTLAQYNQIICVTHLAQVAAFADRHIKISKQVADNSTFTQFTVLHEATRLDELARMSGGLQLGEKTREHAQNMRENAVQFAQALTDRRI